MKLIVEARKCEPRGVIKYNDHTVRCALGAGGLVLDKREGDGGTPIATLQCVNVFYRADRLTPVLTDLPLQAIRPKDGWCDDPGDPLYNQLVKLPFAASHENLWREDHIYDICVVLDWNLPPATPGKGSAIFFHLARENYAPTEGCIAVNLKDMRTILQDGGKELNFETRLAN